MDPELLQQYLAMMLSASPDGDGLDYQKDAYNWLQDQNDLMADPMMALFGGAGTVDPYAFAPQQVDQQEFDVPQNPLQPYLSLSETSEEGAIARAIALGMSPSEAYSKLAEVNSLYKDDPEAAKRARGLADTLFSGYSQYDQQMSTLPDMQRAEDGSWQYQGQGQMQGGKLIVPVMGDSKATRRYTDLGLPTPVDQFGMADFGYGQDREAESAQLAAMRSRVKDDQGVKDARGLYDMQRQFDQQAGTIDFVGDAQPRMRADNSVYSPLDDMLQGTDPGYRQKLEEGAKRAQSGQAGRPALDAYATARKNRSTALSDIDTAAHGDNFDRLYAQKMTDKHQQAGITPLSLIAMQRALALKQRGA